MISSEAPIITLLRVDPGHIDLTRVLEGRENCVLRDFVERDAAEAVSGILLRGAQDFGDVVGDGLALAVGVGRQQDRFRFLRGRPQLLENWALALDRHILGLEPRFHVHAEPTLGQVPDVPDRRFDAVPRTEVGF